MAYELPPHVRNGITVTRDIVHEWDDWDPYSKIALPDSAVKERLAGLSNRGITAFALGCAEWTIGRLALFIADVRAMQYLECFWVYLFGVDEAIPPETEEAEWQGPIKGPVNLALMTVLNTIYLAEQGPPAQNGAFAARISEHVLVGRDREHFLTWQDVVLDRLSRVCSRAEAEPEGQPVPRQVLDPTFPIEAIHPDLVQHAVANTDFSGNPLLREIGRL